MSVACNPDGAKRNPGAAVPGRLASLMRATRYGSRSSRIRLDHCRQYRLSDACRSGRLELEIPRALPRGPSLGRKSPAAPFVALPESYKKSIGESGSGDSKRSSRALALLIFLISTPQPAGAEGGEIPFVLEARRGDAARPAARDARIAPAIALAI